MKELSYIDHPILALYPNVRGYGYAAFREHTILQDSGIAHIPLRNEVNYLERITKMIEIYNPSLILLPTPDGKYNRKRERIRELLKKIRELAKKKNIVVKAYSRQEIQSTFNEFYCPTKVQIAKAINKWYPELTKRCPERRKQYESEDYFQAVYDAVSLVMTYYSDMIEKNKKQTA